MTRPQSKKYPTCYASCSIGWKPEHDLPAKLEAISSAGFDAIELSMPDLISFANRDSTKEVGPNDYETLCEHGKEIDRMCREHQLKILILQPFANFEGWPKGSRERQDAFDRAEGWIRIMEGVGTDMLQVGSSDSPGITTNIDDICDDLTQLADMLSAKGYRMAYENWCWSTHAPDWKEVWRIVERIDRPNVGLCLDTFQSAGGEWADPRTKSGMREDLSQDQIKVRWAESLKKLSATVPPEKIFLLQISDAYRMEPPLQDKRDESGLRVRGQWSHAYRPLLYEGGYLPVIDFTKAVLDTSFTGFLSIEVFDGRQPEKCTGMRSYAERAMKSLQRLLDESEQYYPIRDYD